MAAPWVYLVELTGYTDAAVSSVYRYATLGYSTASTDTPRDTYYADRVISAGNIVRRMVASGSPLLGQRVQVGYGVITLRNNDGGLDAVFSNPAISFRERPVRVLRVRDGAAYSTAEVVLVGAISEAQPQQDEVVIHVKDRLYELASEHITAVYAGNNSLPSGLEGVADIAGKRKPLCMGKVFQIQPYCVNTSRQIYQVSTAAIQSMTVYSGGVVVTAGADYTSQADMETNAPTAGQVRVWPAGGMFRWGGAAPTYTLTADVVADTTANSKAGTMLKRLAEARGIATADISSSDVTALDTANGAVLGIYIDDARITLDAMDFIARTVGAFYGFDRLGILRMARVALPTGANPQATIADWKGLRVTGVPNTEDVPTGTWRLKYARYHRTLQGSELGTSVSDAARSDFGEQWRVSTGTATPSPNPHKRLQEMVRETAFSAKADADTESTRLVGITDEPLYTHLIEGVQLDDETLLDMDLNAEISLLWDRYGFDEEVAMPRLVTAAALDYQAGKCDLTVWGADPWAT